MVIRVGKITGSKVARPKNARSGQARLLQVQIGPQLQTVQLVPGAGEDVNPPDGSVVAILESGGGIKFAVATFDGVTPSAAAGERKLYSIDANGAVKAAVHLKADGTMELNGASKRLVTYAELNSALQGLVTAINALFASKLDGGGTAGTLTLNISAAETTTVKTGG